MSLFLLPFVLGTEASRPAPVTIAPKFIGSPKAIASSTCGAAPVDSDVWYVGYAEEFAKYTWSVPESGCYLLEELHPKHCADIQFSAAPIHLIYNTSHEWSGVLIQSSGNAQWEEIGRFMFDEAHRGALTLEGHDFWIAPHLRISWWNSVCPPPTTVFAPMLLSPHDVHEVTFLKHACYMMEVQVTTYTEVSAVHNRRRGEAIVTSGGWQPVALRMFDRGDEMQISSTHTCVLRLSNVGSVCRDLRMVTVHMVGNFSRDAITLLTNHVVDHVAREANLAQEPYRIIKRTQPRLVEDGLEIELYTIGVEGYRATTLCALVPEVECSASVSVHIAPDMMFVNGSWIMIFHIYFYILIVLVVLITVCYFLLCVFCIRRPPRQRAESPTEYVVGVVVGKEEESKLAQDSNLQKGTIEYVTSHAPSICQSDAV